LYSVLCLCFFGSIPLKTKVDTPDGSHLSYLLNENLWIISSAQNSAQQDWHIYIMCVCVCVFSRCPSLDLVSWNLWKNIDQLNCGFFLYFCCWVSYSEQNVSSFILQILLGWRRRFLCSRFDMPKLPHWYQILGHSCMTGGNTNLILSVPVEKESWTPLISSGPDWYESL
jgi:hypothetical protein